MRAIFDLIIARKAKNERLDLFREALLDERLRMRSAFL